MVSTSGGDADWAVKLIDVFPPDARDGGEGRVARPLGGYQMMVRSEVLRGRYRQFPFLTVGLRQGFPVGMERALHRHAPSLVLNLDRRDGPNLVEKETCSPVLGSVGWR